MKKEPRHVSIYYLQGEYSVNIGKPGVYDEHRDYNNVSESSMRRLDHYMIRNVRDISTSLIPFPSMWFYA